jgi:hypothetical protein
MTNQEKLDREFEALRQRITEADLEERAKKITDHLLSKARRRTPPWEQWRIATEVDRIIRTYEGGER